MEDLQKALLKIREYRILTWSQLAHEIGVSRTTLMNFMDYGVQPKFLTLARINKFIERNKDIVTQREIK